MWPKIEIVRWRSGRPDPQLRYILSVWQDLAHWMMQLTEKGSVTFQEDEEGYPTKFEIGFPDLSLRCRVKKQDLSALIPFLETVHSSLHLFQLPEKIIEKISFDPQRLAFVVHHVSPLAVEKQQKMLPLENWDYLSSVGFYPKNRYSLLDEPELGAESINQALKEHGEEIGRFIPISDVKRPLSYHMYFDSTWKWHFEAYLFEKGDLSGSGVVVLENWAYIEGKGFYAIEPPLFKQVNEVLPVESVSHFVNHHRIWLNGQEGFQTHLASIETHLSYSVSPQGSLSFHTKTQGNARGMMDFGDWIYYRGQGFFSKKHARLGLVVRPGLEVLADEISSFIKTNHEELENVSRFFNPLFPLISRGLEIKMEGSILHVKPVYTPLAQFHHTLLQFFGDYVYLQGEGFSELPLGMRLPTPYSHPVTISQTALQTFIDTELPALRRYLLDVDTSLSIPHQMTLAVHYLARTAGQLKAQLYTRYRIWADCHHRSIASRRA